MTNDEPISPENKMIAKYAAQAFGGKPRVSEYKNASETLSVGILYCEDRPQDGLTSYSTIKLSDYPMKWTDGEYPTRLELAGLALSSWKIFPNVLATAAFRVMHSEGGLYHPGSVITDCVKEHDASITLPHLYLTAPFLWGEELRTLDCGTKQVSWLLAMPISKAEHYFLSQYGYAAFERVLESQSVDFSNPHRPSVF